ncbi:MAG: peptidase and in kexin sedolisin, partial [Solirubrobacterales bacterium]|nr:peptidase and in kexin sedolisin [Solirubrobacterales bacterium]
MREYRSSWRRLRSCAGLCLSLCAAALGAGAGAATALGATPNDPLFGRQWADQNLGQAIPEQAPPEEVLGKETAGTPGADQRVLKAWGVTTGSSSIVIGELDTGVDYNHHDLAANIWTNPGGIGGCPNGHGYNVIEPLPLTHCDPMDKDTGYAGHGTHVAGIMGAVGNDGKGIAGVNWQTTILPVRFVASGRFGGSPKPFVEAVEWLVKVKTEGVNVRVVNDSPTTEGAEPPEVKAAIELLGRYNILFVSAAGNSAGAHWPCADLGNAICVTATDNNDNLPSWAYSNPNTVDLGAPGVSILSTLREPGPEAYGYLTGGSMAAAQVSGAAALILSVAPGLTAEQLKADILNNVDPLPSLAGKVRTGGRLDVCKALPGCEPAPPPPPSPPPPPPPPPPPTIQPSSVALTSTVLRIRHGKMKVSLRCSGP